MASSYLLARAGGVRFAIELTGVAEVLPSPDVARVPGTPPFVLGVTALRGRLTVVLSGALLLGTGGTPAPAPAPGGRDRRRGLRLHPPGLPELDALLLADGVDDLAALGEPEPLPAASRGPLWCGCVRASGEPVAVLDVAALLDLRHARSRGALPVDA